MFKVIVNNGISERTLPETFNTGSAAYQAGTQWLTDLTHSYLMGWSLGNAKKDWTFRVESCATGVIETRVSPTVIRRRRTA
jgi:hypothetical protein